MPLGIWSQKVSHSGCGGNVVMLVGKTCGSSGTTHGLPACSSQILNYNDCKTLFDEERATA